jgi:hypothetical protein
MEIAMLEDFRGHDPNPTPHERAWMETSPMGAVLRVVTLTAIAGIVGLSVSLTIDVEKLPAPAAVAASPSPQPSH